jgi:hypothetical protein
MNIAEVALAMDRAGCSQAQIIAVITEHERERRERLIERKCHRAVARALEPTVDLMVTAAAANQATDGRIAASSLPSAESPERRYMLAREGLERTSQLNATEARVALVILSHLNHKTGRCNPAQDTIAEVAKVSNRTVRRAIDRLGELGLFEVYLHGGGYHQNAYRPDFEAMIALARQEKAARFGVGNKANPVNVASEPVAGGHQTREINKNLSHQYGAQRAKPPKRPDPRQREMLMVVPSGIRPAVAQSKARGRIHAAIADTSLQEGGFNVSALSDADWAAADLAEVRKRGDGIRIIRERVAAIGTEPPPMVVNG